MLLKHVVRSGGRCAAWVSNTKQRRGDEKGAGGFGGDEVFDVTDADHREFVSAGVAAGIAVRPAMAQGLALNPKYNAERGVRRRSGAPRRMLRERGCAHEGHLPDAKATVGLQLRESRYLPGPRIAGCRGRGASLRVLGFRAAEAGTHGSGAP